MNHTVICQVCKRPGDIVGFQPFQCDLCWRQITERRLRFEESWIGRLCAWWRAARG